MIVRPAKSDDAIDIAYIYNYYIATSHATFEIEPVDEAEMLRRIEDAWVSGYPFLVCEENEEIVGYAYGRRFRTRAAYMHSIEVTVYVRPGHLEKSIGTMLYEVLLNEIKKGDFHAVIGGISLPNEASVKLHEKFGFEKVAHFREVGRKFDRWIDVGYWELILDR
ncbi:MAG: N-acetyltransferase family protein [Pyrinomonadaceae bacterium]